MTKITAKRLPNAISSSDIGDPVVKQKVMLMDENVRSLHGQVTEVQRAAEELQRRPVRSGGGMDPEEILAIAAADATLKADAAESNAKSFATSKADAAEASAKSFATSEATSKANTAESSAKSYASSQVSSHAGNTTLHTNATERNTWNGKYSKPSSGIPYADMSSGVKASLDKADQAITSLPAHASNHASTGSDSLTPSAIGALAKGDIAISNFEFTTTDQVSYSSTLTVTKDVSKSGYTPFIVGNVSCYGTGSYTYIAYRACVCSDCYISGNNVILKIDRAEPPGGFSSTAHVRFSVLYIKS